MKLKGMLFKTFFVFLLLCVITLLIAVAIPIALVTFGLESNPLVLPEKKLTIQDVKRIKQMARENDPRKLQTEENKRLSITERDLNLLIYYALSHTPYSEKLNARINLYPKSANAFLTYRLPDNPFGAYLNVTAGLTESSNKIGIEKIKIGALTFPGWLLKPILKYGHKYLQQHEEYRTIIDGFNTIKAIHLDEKKVLLVYQWQPNVVKQLKERGRNLMVPNEERKRLLAYNEQLMKISRTIDGHRSSLIRFLQPLFQMAKERTIAGSDPVAENRAVILTLTIYSIGMDMNRFVRRPPRVMNLTIVEPGGHEKTVSPKEIKKVPRSQRVKFTLMQRNDLALHFLVSAAITVSAGGGMSDLLGLFKEMDDSRGGSGFSFADLTADRAGVKMAEVAMGPSFRANLLQQQMSEALKESDFMPRVDNLPEGIMELEFKTRYQDLDSESYRMIDDEIERRISACQIYQ